MIAVERAMIPARAPALTPEQMRRLTPTIVTRPPRPSWWQREAPFRDGLRLPQPEPGSMIFRVGENSWTRRQVERMAAWGQLPPSLTHHALINIYELNPALCDSHEMVILGEERMSWADRKRLFVTDEPHGYWPRAHHKHDDVITEEDDRFIRICRACGESTHADIRGCEYRISQLARMETVLWRGCRHCYLANSPRSSLYLTRRDFAMLGWAAAGFTFDMWLRMPRGLRAFPGLSVAYGASTYYVSTNGNDANAGTGTANNQAWRTINKARQVAVAGDVVNIIAGTYAESITSAWNAGSSFSDAPVFQNYSGGTVIWKANAGNDFCLRMNSSANNYVIFSGLTIDGTNVNADAVKLDGASGGSFNSAQHIRFTSCTIQNARTDAFSQGTLVAGNASTNRPVGLEFISCVYQNNGSSNFGHNFYLSASSGVLHDGCTFTGADGFGFHQYDGTLTSTDDNTIRNCLSYSNGFYSGTDQGGGYILTSGNNTIGYNLISRDNSTGGFIVNHATGTATNYKIMNCVAVANTCNQGYYGYFVGSGGTNLLLSNCIAYDNGGGSTNYLNNGASGVTTQTCLNIPGNTNTNPQFTNYATRNLTLAAGSGAIDTGTTRAEFSTDFTGKTRSAPWDMGPYDAAAGAFTPSFPVASDFPSVAVLDDFSNPATIAGNWTNVEGSDFTVSAGAAVAPASPFSRMIYSGTQFQPSHDVFATFPANVLIDQGFATVLIFASVGINAVSQWRVYVRRVTGSNAAMQVNRVDSVGGLTLVIDTTDLGHDVESGNGFGVRVSGTTISIYWRYTDGIWYRVAQATDANIPTGSNVYTGVSGQSPVTIDDFGSGPLVSSPPQSPPSPPSSVGVGRFGTTFPGRR